MNKKELNQLWAEIYAIQGFLFVILSSLPDTVIPQVIWQILATIYLVMAIFKTLK